MKNKKKILKELEWDKKEVYEADADRLIEIMKKKKKNPKVTAFYNLVDQIRVKL